jgi:hypothetical protein
MARLVIALVVVLLVGPPLWVEIFPDRPVAVRVGEPPSGTYRLYVAEWGYHASIILEQPPGWRLGPPGQEDAPFVEFAWGDRRFYMESNYWPHSVFATLFLPTSSVAYVAAWSADVEPAAGARARALYERSVTAEELRAVVASIESTIRRDAIGARVAAFPPRAGHRGRFYAAIGDYIWTSNCNRWTLDRLAAADLSQGGGGVVFVQQVSGRLRGFREVP